MSQSLSLTSASLSPTTARGPRVGVVVALMLHAAVVAATLFSWQHKLEIADQSPPVVPVDLVTVGEKTNIAPTVQKIVTPRRETPAPSPAQPTPAPAPAPPPKAEAAPQLLPTPQAKPAPLPQPAAKPTPAPTPTKPKTDAFADLLNNLTKPAATPRNARVADRTVKGIGAMNAMTMDLVDALKNQIAQCWSPPVGGPNSEQLRPQFHLQLNRDGTVVGMPQLTAQSAAEAAGNPYMRAAADAARRAIMTCQPYKLPPDKYDTWRDITSLDFDPSKMVQ
ncbi:MAG TPA: hypothetical protein VJ476_02590 [Rhizomicrobium sp.]|nr:hypothetical protein [Rhizomicrobium sp.]